MDPPVEETRNLRRCLGDLVALSALSAAWGQTDLRDMAESLADVLLRTLRVDFIFVRVNGSGVVFEAVRTDPSQEATDKVQEISRALDPILNSLGTASAPTIANPFGGGGAVRLAVMPLGYGGHCGVLAAASRRLDFPSQTDRLLLSVGANQAAVVLQHKRAEESLREADRRKDEFLALLGHELRNPLAPIRNAVQILSLSGGDPAVVAQAGEMIDRQVGQMTRLVDELLDASRIVQGKVQLKRERLDLVALVRTTAEDHRAELIAAGLTLMVKLPTTSLCVNGDLARLTQVLGNLLHNAVKFTDAGGRVTVRLAQEEELAALSVEDTGVGISPAALPKLFDVFSQVEATVERSKGGLGLGLSVVKGLVELHGGRVNANSAGPGCGAVFTIWVPLDSTHTGPALNTPAPGLPIAGARRKILIIEDGRDAAESLRMLLSLHGFEVAVAFTGTEGVAAAQRIRPDAVVCDLGLPGMSGFDVARALRAVPATASALLVCVSGYGQEQDRRQAHEAGFDEMLVKPPDTDALARMLARPGK